MLPAYVAEGVLQSSVKPAPFIHIGVEVKLWQTIPVEVECGHRVTPKLVEHCFGLVLHSRRTIFSCCSEQRVADAVVVFVGSIHQEAWTPVYHRNPNTILSWVVSTFLTDWEEDREASNNVFSWQSNRI